MMGCDTAQVSVVDQDLLSTRGKDSLHSICHEPWWNRSSGVPFVLVEEKNVSLNMSNWTEG